MTAVVDGIEPLRLALRYVPPGIVVEYAHIARRSHEKRLYHHVIDLQDELSSKRLDVDALVAELVAAHAHVLGGCKVSSRQLARLVRKLADHQQTRTSSTTAATAAAGDTSASPMLPQADYNRVSETQLKQVKMKMDVVFQQNIVRPGEQGYVYDKQVAFRASQEASDWDDDE